MQDTCECKSCFNTKERKNIPIWEQYTLSIEEVAKYFRIGEKKLRKLADEHRDSVWLIMNGNRPQIIRRHFEKFLDESNTL